MAERLRIDRERGQATIGRSREPLWPVSNAVHSWKETRMTMTAHAVGVGSPLPDLDLPSLDGGELRFGDLRGKRLLLFMWGSW